MANHFLLASEFVVALTLHNAPCFTTEEEANAWMVEQVDDHCVDNFRLAQIDNAPEVKEYLARRDKGCCGTFDRVVMIGYEAYLIGCNYGH